MTKVSNIEPKFESDDNSLSVLKSLPGKEHTPSLEILLNAQRSKARTLAKFCNAHLLRPGRISTAIAPSGAGKSNLSEAWTASHLNPHADCFGIEVMPPDERPLLLIDLERTQDEILEGTDRISRRIYAENNPELLTAERFKGVYIHGFLQYAKTEDKLTELERLIEKYNPYLVILDGSASLVYDVNDTKECVYVINLLLALADKNQLSFFCTVHPNPGQQNDFKPRGVFGSELVRQSESVLLLKRAEDNRDVRILTTSFMHGKNRSGSDNLEHYFKWDDNHKMFMSCQYSQTAKPGRIEKQNDLFNEILKVGKMSYSDLCQAIVKRGDTSEATAKRWISEAAKRELIFNDNGTYGLSPF